MGKQSSLTLHGPLYWHLTFCSLMLRLCTCAGFVSWCKSPENTDIFYIFRVIFLASHLTWRLALNFSQSSCSINIDDWRTQTMGTSLSAHPCTCPRAYWSLERRPADRLVGDPLGLLFLGEFRKFLLPASLVVHPFHCNTSRGKL